MSYAGTLTMGFNARYLIDVLGVQPKATLSSWRSPTRSGRCIRGSQDPEYTYVVMPMRL